MSDRIERETRFHDHVAEHQARRSVAKYYAISERSKQDYFERIIGDGAEGLRILELGCGAGAYALPLAKAGARLDVIDISPRSIEVAQAKAEAQGVLDNITFHVMNAEALTFEDQSFDVVCGLGILHHLDLDVAIPELRRVLRPGGRGVFREPLAHNPAINLFRRLTPKMRTVDEHPLTRQDLRMMASLFEESEFKFRDLATFAALPLRRTPLFGSALRALDAVDNGLLAIPGLREWAWVVVFTLTRARR